MTGLEDLLRAATREKATAVTPESIPPLDVATLQKARAGQLPPRFARWPRIAVPLAAAVAVVAVVALSITLPRVLTGRSPLGGVGETQRAPATAGGGGGGRASEPGAIPPYYVALTSTGSIDEGVPVEITVRSTVTGAALATVRAPAPYATFALVASGAGDDTFIVGAQQRSTSAGHTNAADLDVTLLLLHFNPVTRSVGFSSLPVPALVPADLQSVALSPDGSRLAIAVQAGPTVLDLDVYSLTGGAERTWSLRGGAAALSSIDLPAYSGGGGTNQNAMSWLANGHTLAFNLTETDPNRAETVADTVRELDVSGPVGGLLAESRPVFTLDPRTAPLVCLDVLALSADGTTVSCAGYESERLAAKAPASTGPTSSTPAGNSGGYQAATYGFGVYSVATGRLIAVEAPSALGDPLEVDPRIFWQGGDTLIGTLSGSVVIAGGSAEHIIPWNTDVFPMMGEDAAAVAW